jgi:hypothetical protein
VNDIFAFLVGRGTLDDKGHCLASRTRDHVLADEDARDERRKSSRTLTDRPAVLRAGELTLEGTIRDASAGGVFMSTHLLIEIGERGVLHLGGLGGVDIAVQVVWLRGNAHEEGPGMGLCYDDDPERRDAFATELRRP